MQGEPDPDPPFLSQFGKGLINMLLWFFFSDPTS